MQRSEALQEAVRSQLYDRTVPELRELAEEHDIDISGLQAKSDLVDAIALYPGIARILEVEEPEEDDGEEPPAEEEPREEPSDERVPEELDEELDEEDAPEAGEREAEPEEEAPATAEERHPEAEEGPDTEALKGRLRDALRATIDFSHPDQQLRETAQRFKDRSFDAVLAQATDSVAAVEERVHAYVRACWAFGIAAALRIWESADATTRTAQEAKKRLDTAAAAFDDGRFPDTPELLTDLKRAALDLYSDEMERARAHIEAQERDMADIEAMGGDTAAAATLLRKASQALESNARARYLDLISEADEVVRKAREARIEEIQEAAENVETILKEARSIGADVEAAAALLEEARSAVKAHDFATAHDRVTRAERDALVAQKSHMDRVSEMRDRQVEKVRDLIGQIKPLVGEAKSKGFDAREAAELLQTAAAHAKDGDYVNALLKAKEAYRAVKSFRSELEAQRLEETTPVPEPPPPLEPEPEPVPEEGPDEERPPEGESPEGISEVTPQDGPEEAPPAQSEDDESSGGLICPHCGSDQVARGRWSKATCESCGQKFKV